MKKKQVQVFVDDGTPRTNTFYGKVPEHLKATVDVVLAYRPQSKRKKPRKRKKAKR